MLATLRRFSSSLPSPGRKVFPLASLPPASYAAIQAAIQKGDSLPPPLAEELSGAVLRWADAEGAKYRSAQWQPMGFVPRSAGVHNTLQSPWNGSIGSGKQSLSGEFLLLSETDGSSFPTGGLRDTHRAAGHLRWDHSTPPYILGDTLYVPALFMSWTGESLDDRIPLLRAGRALQAAGSRLDSVVGLAGSDESAASPIVSLLGCEQEFFLVDKRHWVQRPDLMDSGRTVVGAEPPNHQQLSDHYMSAMRPRVLKFTREVADEAWAVGISLNVRHNEVAPGQHEVCPEFSETPDATFKNVVLMEIMEDVANRHGLAVLLHEKPFAGINGSGKHFNWSVAHRGSRPFFDLPAAAKGKLPYQRVIAAFAAIIRGVDTHADLLRLAVATPGNDYRLGSHEAPPGIVSMNLGEPVVEVLNKYANGEGSLQDLLNDAAIVRDLGADFVSDVPMPPSDRNRTSSFAFCGNRFEFRAMGSSQNVTLPAVIIDTICAESFQWAADHIQKSIDSGLDVDAALRAVLRESLDQHGRVVYNGNCYANEWVVEAEKRGLANVTSGADALAKMTDEKNLSLFEKAGVLTRHELSARKSILCEHYAHMITTEAKSLLEIMNRHVQPAVSASVSKLTSAVVSANVASMPVDEHAAAVARTAVELSNACAAATADLKAAIEAVDSWDGDDMTDLAKAAHELAINQVAAARAVADEIELHSAPADWTLPSYREMLLGKDMDVVDLNKASNNSF